MDIAVNALAIRVTFPNIVNLSKVVRNIGLTAVTVRLAL